VDDEISPSILVSSFITLKKEYRYLEEELRNFYGKFLRFSLRYSLRFSLRLSQPSASD
ncbi:unnamed protein product, partial [Amoebophrya sp. A25]